MHKPGELHATKTGPPHPPSPTRSLCLVEWGGAIIDEPDYFYYGAFQPSSACSNTDSVEIGDDLFGSKAKSACDPGNSDNIGKFKVCGKTAWFVNEGPVFNDLDQGIGCGLQLQIDSVNYPGAVVDTYAKPCADTCDGGGAFENSYGILEFQNVPICS